MRILFAGTPALAVPSLEAVAGRFDVCGVLTAPDRPAGRGLELRFPAIKEAAMRLFLPVFQPERLDEAFLGKVRSLAPDILVVVAFGRIFRKDFLDLFARGGINLHPSLLPRHRGPSPLSAAILEGDAETGITIQRLALKMDCGDILVQKRFPLDGTETTESLSVTVASRGAELLVDAIVQIAAGRECSVPQDETKATYCRLVTRKDGRIDWQRHDAAGIVRMIHAFHPWPGAWTRYRGSDLAVVSAMVHDAPLGAAAGSPPGKVVGVDKYAGILVQTKSGVLALRELKLQSKKSLDWKSFLNGAKEFVGAVLGE